MSLSAKRFATLSKTSASRAGRSTIVGRTGGRSASPALTWRNSLQANAHRQYASSTLARATTTTTSSLFLSSKLSRRLFSTDAAKEESSTAEQKPTATINDPKRVKKRPPKKAAPVSETTTDEKTRDEKDNTEAPSSGGGEMGQSFLERFGYWIGLAVVAAAGAMAYRINEERKRIAEERSRDTASYGEMAIGGPFELVDQDGNPVTDKDYLGRYVLLYFGFTFCPDICPIELTKMGRTYDRLEKWGYTTNDVVPVMITCDPARDSPAQLKPYVAEFHPKMVGLTGTAEQINSVAKAYRVYMAKSNESPDDDDYLVDHSVFFYLVGPSGKTVAYYPRDITPSAMAEAIRSQIKAQPPTYGK